MVVLSGKVLEAQLVGRQGALTADERLKLGRVTLDERATGCSVTLVDECALAADLMVKAMLPAVRAWIGVPVHPSVNEVSARP